VDDEIETSFRILEVLAESESLMRQDLGAFHVELVGALRTQPTWLTIILIDTNANPVLNAIHPFGAPLPAVVEPTSYREVLETGRPSIGPVARSARRQEVGIPVRVPIRLNQRLTYVLTAVISYEAMQRMVSSPTVVSDEWTRVVVDSYMNVVARSRDPERFVTSRATPSFQKLVREQEYGLVQETSLEGRHVYLSFHRSSKSGWIAAIAVPRESLESPSRRAFWVIGAVGLTLCICFGGLAFLYSRRLDAGISAVAATAGEILLLGREPNLAKSTVKEVEDLRIALVTAAAMLRSREDERAEHLRQMEVARIEAESASEAKDKFLAMLGHELRNPLGAISNGVYLLQQLLPEDPEINSVQAIIERQLTQLTRLIDDLLEASRVAQGKITLRFEVVDLAELLQNLQTDFQHRFEEARIKFVVELRSSSLTVRGDRTRLSQCVSNLLHNSLKFTEAGGVVRLILAKEDNRAVISVEDSGAGIDPELLPRLFQAFVQGPQSLDRKGGGLGLGLSVVKGLVELHGGIIEASSDGVGRGTRMTIRIPLAAGGELAAVSLNKPLYPKTNAQRRVLVIEDISDAADSLRKALEHVGHEVWVAHSGADGIAKATTHNPDVVICDIGLPDMDGKEVCRKILALPLALRPKMIALSGYGQKDDIERSLAAGFHHHMTKPMDFQKLMSLIG
jgi:signal transduction histidine kinase